MCVAPLWSFVTVDRSRSLGVYGNLAECRGDCHACPDPKVAACRAASHAHRARPATPSDASSATHRVRPYAHTLIPRTTRVPGWVGACGRACSRSLGSDGSDGDLAGHAGEHLATPQRRSATFSARYGARGWREPYGACMHACMHACLQADGARRGRRRRTASTDQPRR